MTKPKQLDATDAQILLAQDDDPTVSALSISRTLGIARNTVHARLRRLEDDGALGGHSRRLDPSSMGYGLTAFVDIAIKQRQAAEVYAALERIPEIVEVHATTGRADLLAKVVALDTADLQRITADVSSAPGVRRTSTAVSLQTVLPYRMAALLRRIALRRG